jgi:hypothetical protein
VTLKVADVRLIVVVAFAVMLVATIAALIVGGSAHFPNATLELTEAQHRHAIQK